MFKLQLGLHRILRLLDPTTYFLKIPAIRKAFQKKRGIDDISEYIERSAFRNPETSVTTVWAGIHIGILLMCIEYFCIYLAELFLKKNWIYDALDNDTSALIFIFSLLIIETLINYFALFQKKKYLLYFDDFNKIPRNRMRFYCFICLIVYLSLGVLVIYSFTWHRRI